MIRCDEPRVSETASPRPNRRSPSNAIQIVGIAIDHLRGFMNIRFSFAERKRRGVPTKPPAIRRSHGWTLSTRLATRVPQGDGGRADDGRYAASTARGGGRPA